MIQKLSGEYRLPHLDNFLTKLPSMAASSYILRATTIPFFSIHNHPSPLKSNAVSLNPSFRLPSLLSIRLPAPIRLPPLLICSAPTSPPSFFPIRTYEETSKGLGRRRCVAGERSDLGYGSVVHGHAVHAGAGGVGHCHRGAYLLQPLVGSLGHRWKNGRPFL